MKLSFSTLGCPDWSFGEILSVASDLGYNGIEVRGIADEIYAPKIAEFMPTAIESTKARLKKLGIKIPILTSGAYLTGNPNVGEAEFEIKDYIMLAKALSVPYVRVLGERGPDTEGPSFEEKEQTLAKYVELCKFAQPFGVTLLIETNGFLALSSAMKEFMTRARDMGAANSGAIWDVHHTCRYFGENPRDTLKNIAPFICHTHIKDSVRGRNGKITYMLSGYGDIPVEDAVSGLLEYGYGGYFSYEWVKRWSKELAEPGIAFYSYINYMKSILGN